MRWPRFPHVPPGFGGSGAPPGFPAVLPAGADPETAPARRGRSGDAPKIVRNPTPDPRLRPFTDIVQEQHNSLVRRGYLVRDADLNWSIAPNPFVVARDPGADDDAGVGALRGDHWINSETGAVWYARSVAAGTADWVRLGSATGSGGGVTGTFTSGRFP